MKHLTLNISRVDIAIPNAMASDGDVLANLRGVVEHRADELVAEESRLVAVDELPFWRRVTAGRDESGEGGDDAENESDAPHFVGAGGFLSREQLSLLGLSEVEQSWWKELERERVY